MFALHPQLVQETVMVAELPLCLVLLSKDANYPWCILVPKRADIVDMHHLGQEDRLALSEESCVLSQVMESLFEPVKMNVAALGNVVPQLHVHHIARFEDDPAWPKPIWGQVALVEYQEENLQARVAKIREALVETGLVIDMPSK